MVTSIPINEILLNAINNSQNKISVPILFNTYYREFVRKNGIYTKFSDGLLDFYTEGKPTKHKHSLIVKESRTIKLDDSSFEKIGTFLKIEDALTYYNFTNIKRFLKKKNFDNYIFILRYEKNINGGNKKIITIKPKDNIEEQLYNGKITIDEKTNLILKIEYSLSAPHQIYAKKFMGIKRLKDKTTIEYKIHENNYIISYITNNLRYKFWILKDIYKMDFINDLIVVNYKTENILFNKRKKYKERSLYENGNNYNTEFWKNNNAIPLTKEEENIIKLLNEKSKK